MNTVRTLLRKKFIRDTLILQASKITLAALALIGFVAAVRLMGFENYGVWKLMIALVALWQTLDLTGVGLTTSNGLAMAVGRKDEPAILDLLGYYVKIQAAWSALTVLVLVLLGPPVAARLYDGSTRVGELAGLFSVTIGADALYTMVILSLQSRRLVREMALLQNANQFLLFASVIIALLISPTPEGMVIGRVVYSFVTMGMALVVYTRMRGREIPFPTLRAVLRRAAHAPLSPYWRSGFAMALDKNVGNLYPQLALTLVGVLSGETAAGYLGTGIDLIARMGAYIGAALENMQAVVPQAVGRGDFVGLRRNVGRVLLGLTLIGAVVYGGIALTAPLVVPLLFEGGESAPVVPIVAVLAIYGMVTTPGGVFGAVYRALGRVTLALGIKLLALAIMLPVGLALIPSLGALGGAWLMNGLFAVSVGLTAVTMWRALDERARA